LVASNFAILTQMAALRKLASQTVLYGISSVLGRMVHFVLVPIHTSRFTPDEYGIVSDLLAYTTYFLILLTFGMETSFFRFASKEESSEKALANSFYAVLTLAVSFFICIGFSYQSIAGLLGYGNTPMLVLMTAGLIVLDVIAAPLMASLRYHEKASKYVALSLVSIFLNIILNIVFIYVLHMGIESVFWGYLISSGIKLLLLLPEGIPSPTLLDNALMKEMLSYGALIMLAGMAGAINENLDKNLIVRLWPDGKIFNGAPRTARFMAGIYAANYKLAMFIALVTQAFRYAAEPFFFRQVKQSDSKEIFAKSFHYFMIACFGMFLFITGFSKEIVAFNFFGLTHTTLISEQYWMGLPIVPVILLANICLGAYINLSIWFKLTGQLNYGLKISFLGASITLILNILLIPVIGYSGSAWATLICYFTMAIWAYLSGRKHYPIPYRMYRLGFYIAIALIVFAINRDFASSIAMRLILIAAWFGILVYFELTKPLFHSASRNNVS